MVDMRKILVKQWGRAYDTITTYKLDKDTSK